MRRFRHEYGFGPLHALGLAASFALTGYAVLRIADGPSPLSVLLWFLAAILAHDFVLFPLYSLVDRIGSRVLAPARSPRAVSPLNHVRVPVLLSGLMLLVWFPLVLGLSEPTFRANTGLGTDGYLARWLLLTGALFAGSGLTYALRRARAARTT